ncbi:MULTISPECIES: V-type ATPase subunit [unclassified Nocardia]|uniref:V-type ATPase subunit n=1 Tax=unclassified Nocardia TaxID=2637762 RepID=UPI001CE4757C|nr:MULTISPECIES: V-type ATPase subunit [unclassified Nocardia]
MSAGWVAGNVRAVALSNRCLGAARARELAASGSLTAAQRYLADGPYRRGIDVGASLADTEDAIAATALWQLRVLAGWQPRPGARMIRTLAGGFELANIRTLAAALDGRITESRPFELGALAIAWNRLRDSASTTSLRAALRQTPWGDPGGDSAADIAVGTALTWANRVVTQVPAAVRWASGGAALLVARHRLLESRTLTEPGARQAVRLLGSAAVTAADLTAFTAALPVAARWALIGTTSIDELWRAEFRWWSTVARDGAELLHANHFGAAKPVGAVAVLGADAWRVRAALHFAAAGAPATEAYDELV